MSLWADYIGERLGEHLIEDDCGFIQYYIEGEMCQISEIYVRPELRQKGLASRYADQVREVATAAGCKLLVCYVYPSAVGATEALRAILAYGFKLRATDGPRIMLSYSLEGKG